MPTFSHFDGSVSGGGKYGFLKMGDIARILCGWQGGGNVIYFEENVSDKAANGGFSVFTFAADGNG